MRDAADLGEPRAQTALGWTFATSADPRLRNGSNAVLFAEKAATATSRTNTTALETLAAAYAETGDFDKASKDDSANQDYATRLKLYESKKAYHEAE